MIKKNTYSFIHIGLYIRYISSFKTQTTIKTTIEAIEDLRTTLSRSELNVTLVSCDWIKSEFEKKIAGKPHSEELGKDLHSFICTSIESIESTVHAESTTKLVYIIPNRKYNGDYLLNEAHKLLSGNCYSKLSAVAKADFSNACKCLLYGQGTAAAFHLLRATEDTLKNYYFKYKKTKRLKVPMWGPMTDQLRKKKTNKPNPTILNSLDMVRTSYRNPTQHPEATYTIDQAESLFGVCIDLINHMSHVL